MKVIFPVMGAENISVCSLSAALKEVGHSVKVAFDRALFDDKQYFSVDFLARIFSAKKKMIDSIVNEKPDILALSCFADNYQWSLDVVRKVKEKNPECVSIWGGIHPTSVPDEVIKIVDFILLSISLKKPAESTLLLLCELPIR